MLTEKRIIKMYMQYKAIAKKNLYCHNYNTCVKFLTAASHTAYSFYIGIKDEEIEDMLCSISNIVCKNEDKNNRKENECIVYDDFSIDNGGLTQQYLLAIMNLGYKIHYITSSKKIFNETSVIGNLLHDYGRADITVIPSNLNPIEKVQFIYDFCVESEASKLFIHTKPWSVISCCAFYALPKTIIKYKINLTDHTFWIGTRFIDYSFEFRPYGCQLSIHGRGIPPGKVLYLPFYPIMNHIGFQGFPEEADGKLILFAGGDYYKIFDSEDSFFKLSKLLLDSCPNLLLLFAGSGDKLLMENKIEEYGLKNRFIPIGRRTDITEVFEHCDIFLNTYPIGGGLMSQYAAQLGKPIVSYCTSVSTPVEDLVCQKKRIRISSTTFEELVSRVISLAGNATIRREFGDAIRNCVVTSKEFNNLFARCMKNNTTPLSYKDELFKIKEYSLKDKIEFENSTKDFHRSIVKILGAASLWYCPDLVFDVIINKRFITALLNRFEH